MKHHHMSVVAVVEHADAAVTLVQNDVRVLVMDYVAMKKAGRDYDAFAVLNQ